MWGHNSRIDEFGIYMTLCILILCLHLSPSSISHSKVTIIVDFLFLPTPWTLSLVFIYIYQIKSIREFKMVQEVCTHIPIIPEYDSNSMVNRWWLITLFLFFSDRISVCIVPIIFFSNLIPILVVLVLTPKIH